MSKILVTFILFGAENDAATRFCLTALLSALQKMCEKRAWPTTPSIISFTNFDNNEYYFFDQRGSFEAKPHELFFASCTFKRGVLDLSSLGLINPWTFL